MLLTVSSSIYLFLFVMLFKGSLAAWQRYFCYALPVAMAWLPYELGSIKHLEKTKKTAAEWTAIASLIVCGLLVFNTYCLSDIRGKAIPDEFSYLKPNTGFIRQKEIAQYITDHQPTKKLLFYSFTLYGIFIALDNPQNVITTSSYEFKAAVESPGSYEVDYIIIPDTGNSLNTLDAINEKYPDLYKEGAAWCSLEKDFGDIRLYKVLR